MVTKTFRHEVKSFHLEDGANPETVLVFNTATLQYAVIRVIGGSALIMSDDLSAGMLINDGQSYTITASDYYVPGLAGEEVVIRMKATGGTDVNITVQHAYRIVGV